MELSSFLQSYFNGFQDILNYKENDAKNNGLAALKILSYFTVLISLAFAALYGATSLYGRVSKKEWRSSSDIHVNDQAKQHLQLSDKNQCETIQNRSSEKIHSYTGDLDSLQKSKIPAVFMDDSTLKIQFPQNPDLSVTIRRQDLFLSGAQVIINAANTHLGGGGGIDGAIHKRGGPQYVEAHKQLKNHYKSNFVSGYAALIQSGSLNKSHKIENVIVVAGPSGDTDHQKENALYSCYYNSLLIADNEKKASIAFPSISTGLFGFPADRAAAISLKAIYDFIENYPETELKSISIHFLPDQEKSTLENYENGLK